MVHRGMYRVALSVAALGVVASAPADAVARGCEGSSAHGAKAAVTEVRAATLCLVNRQRRHHGLRRVRRSTTLENAAQGHSADMAAERYFAHDAPDGSGVLDRVRASGFLASAGSWLIGETLYVGGGSRDTPRATVRAWMHSPGHRAILLDPRFAQVGIGVAPGGGSTYFTADFGRR